MADETITYRRAILADADVAFAVYRAALNDYLGRAGQELVPDENDQRPGFAHMLHHDGERCWVAERDGDMVAWGSALLRGDWWFLSALFVLPGAQGAGVGAELLRRAGTGAPAHATRATVTDSLQPLSNGLYARRGMLPREALIAFAGPPRALAAEAGGPPRGLGSLVPEPLTGATLGDVRAVDLAVLGFDRTVDHRFYLDDGGRRGWLFRRAGRAVAYALYRPTTGWVGPLASRRVADVGPILRFVLAALADLGIERIKTAVPAPCAAAQRVCWELGLLYDSTPALLLASRRFARLDRYLPASFGMF